MSQKKINELAERIFKARNHYYNGDPILSDAAFDILVDELRGYSPDHPAITDVGAPVAINSEWQKGNHQIPMGSLDKIKNPEQLETWVNKVFTEKNSVFITEKLDGISIELVYIDGKLDQAITRGDGVIGEDITANVVRMNGVKKILPTNFTGSLRGEIVLKRSNHKKYFSNNPNPRNAAGGTAKRLDGAGCEYLDIFFYQAIGDEVDFLTEHFQFKFLEELGLNVPNYDAYVGKDKVKFINDKWNNYQKKIRESLDYDIDGLVVRVNDLVAQMQLGETDMRPEGARAYKFPSDSAKTKVVNIFCQTGNSGRITPVGEVNPVLLAGAMVTKASLYNFSYINELGLDVGCEVVICRAGDVIPRIETVITGTGKNFKAPTKCPACAGDVEMVGENLMCINTDACPAQVVGRIKNWIGTLNILEWGDALIERLVESEFVENIPDLYKLTIEDIASIDRMGEKSATKCYNLLRAHNPISLEDFLGGLSIPMVGSSIIKMVKDSGLDSLEKILEASQEDFKNVHGLGPAKSKFLFVGLKKNQKIISELLSLGIKIKEKITGPLVGKAFCFTGTMKNKRASLEKMVIDNGGEVKSVGKTLSFLVINDINSNTSKAQAARKFGTKLVSEDDFLKMINK